MKGMKINQSILHILLQRIYRKEIVTSDCENSFDAFPTDGIVDVAQIFAGILNFGLFDDQRPAHLLDSIVQLDRLLGCTSLHVFVPPGKEQTQLRLRHTVKLIFRDEK